MSTDAYIICEDCGEELELVNIQKWKWRDSFAYKIKPCQSCIQEAVNRVVVPQPIDFYEKLDNTKLQ